MEGGKEVIPQNIPDFTRPLWVRTTHDLLTSLEYSILDQMLIPDSYTRALVLAMSVHFDDLRTNGHQFDHIFRVTKRIVKNFQIADPEIICASLLHDTVEDHPELIVKFFRGDENNTHTSIAEKALWYIEKEFGPETSVMVSDLTNPIFSTNKNTEYYNHIKNLINKNPKAAIIKLSDFIDNAVGNHHTAPAKRLKLDFKYYPVYELFIEMVLDESCILNDEAKEFAHTSLMQGRGRSLLRIAKAMSSAAKLNTK